PERRGRFPRNYAEVGLRIGRMRLDLEPYLEAGLGFPDRGHFRAGVAGDHRRLTDQMRILQRWVLGLQFAVRMGRNRLVKSILSRRTGIHATKRRSLATAAL